MNPVEVNRGNSPIVLGLPHTGTHVPDDIFCNLNALGQTLGDTDWHVDRLYEGLLDDVTTVRATFHRYVIDANRNPEDESLYPGQNTTALVPLTNFDGHPIWIEPPGPGETAARLEKFHKPYHAALSSELKRIHALHGVALLYDCHSIRSSIPFLFEGKLPDFNIGTNDGHTCDPSIESAVQTICADAAGFSAVLNGRFKGGWTTRHYGRPETGYHAIQMELAQSTHLTREVPPFDYNENKAAHIRSHLERILETLVDLTIKLV